MNEQNQGHVQEHSGVTTPKSSNIEGIAKRLKEQGLTSRQVGEDKRLKCLRWVYKWGFCSPSLLDEYGSPGRRGLSKKMVETGYLETFPNAAGGEKGIPKQVVCLTKKGQMLVETYIDDPSEFVDQKLSDGIPWHQLRHDYLVQRATIKRLMTSEILSAISPLELAQKSAAGVKQPDAIWVYLDGKRFGIELEMTRKAKAHERSLTVQALLRSVKPGENGRGFIDHVIIISPSAGILKEYQKWLAPGSPLDIYDRDASRRWVLDRTTQIPNWAADKFVFSKMEL